MQDTMLRVFMFYEFCFNNKLNGSVSIYDGEFVIIASKDGKIYSSGEAKTLTEALDQCGQGFKSVGLC